MLDLYADLICRSNKPAFTNSKDKKRQVVYRMEQTKKQNSQFLIKSHYFNASCASMGCATTHCMISSALSPSQNSCMHPTPGGDSPTPTTDKKSFAFIRRCIRTGFCSPDLADFHDLYISSDEKLFNKILTCPNHILRTLLPTPTAQNYSLRNRPHNRQLSDRISRITDCNFTLRMFYRNMY